MMQMSGNRKDGDGVDNKVSPPGMQTHIRRGFGEDSEEDLVAYAGNIRVKTEIVHSQEERSSPATLDDRQRRI